MKRIVVVTWTGKYNYGTSLQSYALQKALELKGYETHLLDRFFLISEVRYFLKCLKRLFKKDCVQFESEKLRNMSVFHEKEQNVLHPFTKQQLKKIVAKTDVFISGSDQIWNTAYRFDPNMFLSFVSDKRKISYASSIGTNFIPEEHKKAVKRLLASYKKIAVREKTAVEVLQDLTGRCDVEQVLDPTFLLTRKEWDEFCSDAKLKNTVPEDYMLCYFIGQNQFYASQIESIRSKTSVKNIVVVLLRDPLPFEIKDSQTIDYAGPKEFVHLIKNASMICTDSFHATAISINYSKKFVNLLRFSEQDNNSQNSRMHDLLDHYGLKKRLFSQNDISWNDEIDYVKVHQILNNDREKSWNYLIDAIEEL